MGCFGRKKKADNQKVTTLPLIELGDGRTLVGYIVNSGTGDPDICGLAKAVPAPESHIKYTPYSNEYLKSDNVYQTFQGMNICPYRITAHEMKVEVTTNDTFGTAFQKVVDQNPGTHIDTLDLQLFLQMRGEFDKNGKYYTFDEFWPNRNNYKD
ncbi:hypothetical protein COEREDRAFT_90096 [Coemansia reversa NRRL 1564]|uniref:Uncharacterized protein n=1 Tax=Coemansia reversa (strain ATCC 12441 / NRRL 1564) TaxID=763665 RepID=A0A2G5B132_COERN|nr:hypothetical protein COEREDRAFT_90096 [Coemansia reversa NRRL 1564]|eukprot:PIA12722.1 hypothetical protein COEREDRAFT_90096 [Coemansia reversa NRRL 1564]